MAQAFRLPEQAKIVQLLTPAADAGGRTGQYVTCKNFHKLYIVCHIAQGNAATVQLSVLQAKDVSGTSSKAIGTNVPIWADTDESVSDALVAQTAGTSYTTDAGTKNKVVVFEVDPAYLDQANGFVTVTVQTGASNAANVTEAMAYGIGERYAQATPPSAIVN